MLILLIALNAAGYEQPGIYVSIQVWGEVRNPGHYAVPPNINIVEAISFAGGPLRSANLNRVKVCLLYTSDAADELDGVDLGADVPPEKFVEAVKEHDANIVAMSALLTVTMPEMKNVIDELKKTGLRDKVKVIVGGAPVTEEYAKSIGADGYGETAVEGVRICKQWATS